jgi:thiamine kinase-like enzyme
VTGQSVYADVLALRDGITASDHATLDSAFDRHAPLSVRPRRFAPLTGGLTNRSYRATLPSGLTVVARLSAGRSSVLAIDRVAESHNARIAAAAGVGPGVVACEPDNGFAVFEWIQGRTFSDSDLDDSVQLARVAELCRVLHDAPRFANDFDMFTIQARYLAIVRKRGYRLPSRYLDFVPHVARIRAALAVQHHGTVACHNDLLAANIMDDGQRLWFVDYEYAGNNDACFELGNVWSEANLGIGRLDELVTGYYGFRSPARIARARLWALMAKYGWTLWASIQDAVSEVDFDFWSWGMEKYERAVAEFDGPEFEHLINDVQQPDQPRGSTP